MNLQAIRTRAAARLAAQPAHAAGLTPPANPANWLTPAPRISQLATLAGSVSLRAPCDGPALPDADSADAETTAHSERRARLLRWGWAAPQAEALAARLTRRDREQDARVSCIDCKHYRPGRCGNYRRAGISAPDVGRDMAVFLQRCPGFLKVTT